MCSVYIKFADARNVSIAGNFNNWTPQVMKYEPVGMFNYITIKTNIKDNKQIIFKFVYGDNWFTSTTYKTKKDDCNNLNNYINVDDVENQEKNTLKDSKQEDKPQLTSFVSNSSIEASSDKIANASDDSDSLDTTEDTQVDTTSHGTSGESLYYKVWVWLMEFFNQLFK